MGWDFPLLNYFFGAQAQAAGDWLEKWGWVFWLILVLIIVVVAVWAYSKLRR